MLAPCPVGSLNHKDRFAGIPARFNLFAKCSSLGLSVNSRSAFDLQAVLDALVERVANLCGGEDVSMFRSRATPC
jgi:hypothetical protein